tara:strand:- start:1882 stop:2937 length:1056 start_codon:yes stop_codon:yes gene_type:complete
MSSYIDKKFINMISPQLEKFSWKKDNLAACRCPICGDSQKNKNKTRGYFYVKNNDFFFKCHNCGVGYNLYNFLKEVSPSMCKEYSLERYRNGETGKSNYKKPEEKDLFKFIDNKPKFKKKDEVLNTIECIKDLPKDHIAVKFANMRMIPKQHWGLLYYSDNFGNFAKELDPSSVSIGSEERLVIPFFNSHGDVVGCQGRALKMEDEVNARETLKYITVKYDKGIDRLWYGLWRVNPNKRVYVVEGPLDSLFLNNATAMVGAGALKQIPERFDNTPMTFILDNEPRNRQICAYIEKLIELDREVCIWPDNIKEKDINDMAYRMSTRKIQKMIDENTYSGLQAKLRFAEWRKI